MDRAETAPQPRQIIKIRTWLALCLGASIGIGGAMIAENNSVRSCEISASSHSYPFEGNMDEAIRTVPGFEGVNGECYPALSRIIMNQTSVQSGDSSNFRTIIQLPDYVSESH